MSATEPWICPTCAIHVATPFCPMCGESPLRPPDLTLRGIGAKVLHAATSIDGRLLRTFWVLLRHPGELTVAHLNGKRMPYVPPFQLFLIANAFFFAMQSLTDTQIFGSTLVSHLYHQDWVRSRGRWWPNASRHYGRTCPGTRPLSTVLR